MSGEPRKKGEESGITRRGFLKVSGVTVGALGMGALSNVIWLEDSVAAFPVSEGYLLVDYKKCQGCCSCMLACSLAHDGVTNLSKARIQVIQDEFKNWPNDLEIDQCRQCEWPKCVDACPTGALGIDPANGNVRMLVNPQDCLGCGKCRDACPYTAKRSMLQPEDESGPFGLGHSRKCDLCVDTPHWNRTGGPGGEQACIKVCPVEAITFTADMPVQTGDSGYNVNLRDNPEWAGMGYPTED